MQELYKEGTYRFLSQQLKINEGLQNKNDIEQYKMGNLPRYEV